MFVRRLAIVTAAAAVLSAASGAAMAAPATVAQAQAQSTSTKPLDFTVHAESTPNGIGTQTMKWDAAKGRWGVTVNLQQPETRSTTLNDIQAGAYYKITPALRVGGALTFGDQTVIPGPKPNTPDISQPRVQLETKLKF